MDLECHQSKDLCNILLPSCNSDTFTQYAVAKNPQIQYMLFEQDPNLQAKEDESSWRSHETIRFNNPLFAAGFISGL